MPQLQRKTRSLEPIWATLDLTSPGAWQNLHPVLAQARERHPLARDSSGEGWSVLRYAELDGLLRDPRVESQGPEMLARQGLDGGPFHEFVGRMLFTQNGPDHARLRALVGRAFTPSTAARMRPRVREIAHELIDRVQGLGAMDVVRDFAHHLPVRVISEMIGVPEGDYTRFAQWTSDLGLGFSLVLTPDRRRTVDAAVEQLHAYVSDLVEERRRRPGSDLVSALIQAEEAGDRLSHEELIAMVMNLLFGGHDTTKSLLQIATYTLLSHPQELERVRRDSALLPSAVEEVLRYEPVVTGVIRVVCEPFEMAGVKLDLGEPLVLSLISANRDPRRFPQPDRFDVGRRDNRHFGFGFGLHFCVGAALARVEGQEALGVLVERLPGLCLAERPRWVPFTAIRRLESLRVTF
ncbi:MAG: cytochrome P450 [Deltaproteobacteria bacterium]|nr:cytochrome P450 [Deltaproteobacteria bacterium]